MRSNERRNDLDLDQRVATSTTNSQNIGVSVAPVVRPVWVNMLKPLCLE